MMAMVLSKDVCPVCHSVRNPGDGRCYRCDPVTVVRRHADTELSGNGAGLGVQRVAKVTTDEELP